MGHFLEMRGSNPDGPGLEVAKHLLAFLGLKGGPWFPDEPSG